MLCCVCVCVFVCLVLSRVVLLLLSSLIVVALVFDPKTLTLYIPVVASLRPNRSPIPSPNSNS
jgi:hypothetical protein